MANENGASPAAENTASSDTDTGSGLSDIAQEFLAESDGENAEETDSDIEASGEEGEEYPPIPDLSDDDDDTEFVVGGKAPKKPEVFKEVLKVNGKEIVVDSMDKLKAAAQRGLAMQSQYEKAKANIEAKDRELNDKIAQVRQMLDEAKDPAAYLEKLHGPAAVDAAEKLLLARAKEAMEMEGMSEREKEYYLKAKDAEKYKAAHEEAQKKHEETQAQQLAEAQKQQLSAIFGEALKVGGLPANTATVRRMSHVYRAALRQNVELTPEACAKEVRRQIEQESTGLYGEMEPAEFVKLNPKFAEKMRAHFASAAKQRPSEVSDVKRQKTPAPTKRAKSTPDDEWENTIKKMVQRGAQERVKNRW